MCLSCLALGMQQISKQLLFCTFCYISKSFVLNSFYYMDQRLETFPTSPSLYILV